MSLQLAAAVLSALLAASLQNPKASPTPPTGYDDTRLLPGGEWRVHDGKRPRPLMVSPATYDPQQAPAKAPSDAIVLFDGKDLSRWQRVDGTSAGWKVENGYFEVVAKSGDVVSREAFSDCQLHIEWATPSVVVSSSQNRGNSGIFLMGLYEVQVLDSYNNLTYADGQAGAIYGQTPPLVNASRKPGEWQTYDIVFAAPRFKDGKLVSPAYATVLHNGVLVQNHQELLGPTVHRALAAYTPHDSKAPLRLQDHNNPVRFRNIWIRPLGN